MSDVTDSLKDVDDFSLRCAKENLERYEISFAFACETQTGQQS